MDPRSILEHPRYKENLSDFFFEMLIVDTIAPLDPEAIAWVAEILKCGADSWRAKVRARLTLADTIDVAILDLWYRNREIAQTQGIDLDVQSFSIHFVDNYYKEESAVDHWGPGALEDAKARIASYRDRERSGLRSDDS